MNYSKDKNETNEWKGYSLTSLHRIEFVQRKDYVYISKEQIRREEYCCNEEKIKDFKIKNFITPLSSVEEVHKQDNKIQKEESKLVMRLKQIQNLRNDYEKISNAPKKNESLLKSYRSMNQ